jgi:hypothetical protein
VRENVTISYRGASYEIGRGPDFYGIWAAGAPRSQPAERWPRTPEGWYGAWARFAGIETPGTIVPVGPGTVPVSQPATTVSQPATTVPVSQPAAPVSQPAAMVSQPTTQISEPTAPISLGTLPVSPGTVTIGQAAAPVTAPRAAATSRKRAVIAAALLIIGIAAGIAGLFPSYLGGASLASDPAEWVPHAIYLAGWAASAILILLGGTRQQVGALLGIGISIVTFGLFFADAGTAIAGGASLAGAGLVLGLVSWLACAAGSVLAFGLRRDGAPGRPRGQDMGPVLILILAGLGAAIAFAPAWDSYTLRTATTVQTLTAGNAFANPGLVIAGDVAVMVALAAAVIAAALWRPVFLGAALLAGAIIPMAAQAISALVSLGEGTSPATFGIPAGEAAQAGLTISSGVTPAFWLYCAFVAVLIVMCVRMFRPSRPAAVDTAAPTMVSVG